MANGTVLPALREKSMGGGVSAEQLRRIGKELENRGLELRRAPSSCCTADPAVAPRGQRTGMGCGHPAAPAGPSCVRRGQHRPSSWCNGTTPGGGGASLDGRLGLTVNAATPTGDTSHGPR